MGIKIRVLDPTPACPAAAAASQTVGSFTDPACVAAFAASEGGIDILTAEIEHVDAAAMDAVAAAGVDVEPTPSTLRLIQDKYAQKVHFAGAGVPVPPFCVVDSKADAEDAGARFGFPLMLKSRRGAYDGKGNAVARSAADLDAAAASLGGWRAGALYAEGWAPFVKELAVMVGRDRAGATVAFPVVETVHRDSICWVTEAPAAVPEGVAAAAAAMAQAAVAALDGAGVFGCEMFLLGDGTLLLNEVAPRPHNSGHYTIEACPTSQYEQHLRAVMGWPLGEASLAVGCAIMVNILGEADGEAGEVAAHARMAAGYATPGASVHWYGKHAVAVGRKVGHITITARTREEARSRLEAVDAGAAAALAGTGRVETGGTTGATGAAATSSTPAGHKDEFGGTGAPVAIIMGSDSDLATMRPAAAALAELGIAADVTVVSAHRTPDRMVAFARSAPARGVRVIIAGAGGAAHLPGMVASLTPLPVVGVPVTPPGARLDGVDALLSIVQMPAGVPVATVGVGAGRNAGLLAARILGASDPAIAARLAEQQVAMKEAVLAKAARLEREGWEDYKV